MIKHSDLKTRSLNVVKKNQQTQQEFKWKCRLHIGRVKTRRNLSETIIKPIDRSKNSDLKNLMCELLKWNKKKQRIRRNQVDDGWWNTGKKEIKKLNGVCEEQVKCLIEEKGVSKKNWKC